MDSTAVAGLERRLGGALEPVIGQVYFSPEAHRAYAALGFDPSPGDMNGVALPDGPAYFTSRGSLLGQVPGELVAATFAVFSPAGVVPAVTKGWRLTDAPTICAARDQGALGQLERVLGAKPAGLDRASELLRQATDQLPLEARPLAAGVSALDDPDHPLGVVFRRGDLLREFRGDSHNAAWITAGLTAIDIGLLTELYWGLPLRSYSRTRGWTDDQYDVAEDSLRHRGLISADGTFTDAGRAVREQVEINTDNQMAPVMRALGDDCDELITILTAWSADIRAANGYPSSGPHELAEQAAR